MRSPLLIISALLPLSAFAAGGYIGPEWLTYLMYPLLIPPLFLFFYIGYLCLCVVKKSRATFISLYVLVLLCAAAFVGSTAYLLNNENIGWVERVCLISLMLVPLLMAYATYKLNSSAIGERHAHMLRNSWYAAIASFTVLIAFPFFLMIIQVMFPFMQFYL